MLRHNQYDGWIRRVDEDLKVVVQAKVPKARLIDRSTTVVLAANQSRLLLIHHDDQMHFPAKHKVALLDVATLKTLLELPLGECQDPRGSFPVMTEQLTMVCHHSRPPDQPKRRPTFALVTLNLNRGEVVRWFPLEGERHGAWFGPMFSGTPMMSIPFISNEAESIAHPRLRYRYWRPVNRLLPIRVSFSR